MISLIAVSRFIPIKRNDRITKNKLRDLNITRNRMRVALLTVLATCITGLAPGFSTTARAGSFRIDDVSGKYVWHAQGWDLGGTKNKPESVPLSAVGLITYNSATVPFTVSWS